MKRPFQSLQEQTTPSCCLLSICYKQQEKIISQKANNGLISHNIQQQASTNSIKKSQLLQNISQPQLKRSISALKIKRNRQNADSQSITHEKSSEFKKNKFICTSMDQQILKYNYCKDNPFQNVRDSTQNFKENSHYQSNNMKPNNFLNFKKDKQFNQGLISVNKNQFFSPRYLKSPIHFKINQYKPQQIQQKRESQMNKNILRENIEQQNYKKEEKIYKIQEDLKESKYSQAKPLILQVPKQLIGLQQINSYIASNSKVHSKSNNQQQFDSIKTKGKPVQSMLYVSSNLKKTKKRVQLNQNQRNMQNLQNRTVYSQYQSQNEQIMKKQKIQQSAVLVNFFHPPTYIKEKLNLSTRYYN